MLAPPPLPRNLAAALRDVSSEKKETRASAVGDLARHATSNPDARRQALPLFEKALRDDEPIVRSAAAMALADVKAGEALPALLVAVEDPSSHVRQMALSALGEIGDVRARPRVERALEDDRPDVRYQAIIALVHIAKAASGSSEPYRSEVPPDVDAALVRAMKDDDEHVRYIALRLAEEERLEGRSAIAERAKSLLADALPGVALAAAILLARAGDSAARAKILDVVKSGARGASTDDEQAAIELAGEIGMREAIPDLEKRAWGLGRFVKDTGGWHAKIALAAMGHARAREDIVGDLDSWRAGTRQAAIVAAGRARIAEARTKIEGLRDRDDPMLVDEALARLR